MIAMYAGRVRDGDAARRLSNPMPTTRTFVAFAYLSHSLCHSFVVIASIVMIVARRFIDVRITLRQRAVIHTGKLECIHMHAYVYMLMTCKLNLIIVVG